MLRYILFDTDLFDSPAIAIGSADLSDASVQMRACIEDLVKLDLHIIERRREEGKPVPKLTDSGVTYSPAYDLRSLEAVMESGSADVDSLCAWRAAELRDEGIQAVVEIYWKEREGGGRTYSCRVRLPDGSHDEVVEEVMRRRVRK